VDVVVPKIGLTVEQAEVLAWHRAVGDPVAAGDALVDLAADKTDVEIEAPGDGVLVEILAAAGAVVAPGAVLGRIGASVAGGAPSATAAPATDPPVPDDDPPEDANGAAPPSSPVARRAAERLGVNLAALAGTGRGGRVVKADVERAAGAAGDRIPLHRPRSSPAARRLARELGVELAAVAGTGPEGRIVEADVRRGALEEPAAPAAPAEGLEEVRWTAARRMTARRMAESARTVAPVTLHRRADADAALATAASLKAAGVPATFTHVLLRCVAAALGEHPALNAVWDGERLMRSREVDIGLAVDVDDQLLVPVVRDAGALSTADLARIAGGLVARCRSGTASADDLRGATFSVSNLGMLGVEQFTPIVNPPQVAILGVGAIARELVPSDDGFAVRRRCHLSLTFDHRAVDGAPAARFLDALVTGLQGSGPAG
jgi:pyruvate dehydrogenase E2 component (dihydrolipoamide acetyltransferase)